LDAALRGSTQLQDDRRHLPFESYPHLLFKSLLLPQRADTSLRLLIPGPADDRLARPMPSPPNPLQPFTSTATQLHLAITPTNLISPLRPLMKRTEPPCPRRAVRLLHPPTPLAHLIYFAHRLLHLTPLCCERGSTVPACPPHRSCVTPGARPSSQPHVCGARGRHGSNTETFRRFFQRDPSQLIAWPGLDTAKLCLASAVTVALR
jgi:hypothetical protein